MDAPLSIPNDGNTKQLVQASIKQKLSELMGGVDDVLPEYVMVMVSNHKSKSQVASDLEAFLPDQALLFTNWLWDNLIAMNSDTKKEEAPIKRELTQQRDRDISPTRSVFASVVTVPPERPRTSIDNPAPSRLILSAVQDAVRSTAPTDASLRERERERDREQEREREIERERDNRRDRDYRADRDRDRDRDIERDRGDQDRSRGDRGNWGDRDNRDRRRDKRGRENYRPRDGVFDRLGSRDQDSDDRRDSRREPRRFARVKTHNNYGDDDSNIIDTTTSSNVFLPDTSVIAARRKKEGQDQVTFTVTLNGVKDDKDPVDRPLSSKRPDINDNMEEDDEGSAKKVKKEKCTFYPNCKKGDECAYFHPTVNCKLFPNCTYGDKCLYIHPSIPCKFGAQCTRPDCTFTHHPSLSNSGSSFAKPLSINSALPSGFGAAAAAAAGVGGGFHFAPIGGKPCKNGFACAMKETCVFIHPPTACVYGNQCARPGCAFAHGKLCRSGVTCGLPGCSFVHAPVVKTPCRFGTGCLNTTCRFSHDMPAKGTDAAMADADTTTADAEDTKGMSASLPLTPPAVSAS